MILAMAMYMAFLCGSAPVRPTAEARCEPQISERAKKGLLVRLCIPLYPAQVYNESGYLIGTVDPIRKQLLGTSTKEGGYYRPSEVDVLLRTWLKANRNETFALGNR